MRNLKTLHFIGNILILFCTILEGIIFHSFQDLFSCAVLLYGWNLINIIVLTKENYEKHFVSFVAFLGYAVCFWLFPLIVTLFELKPLTFRFALPYITFYNQAINVTVLVCAFKFSTYIYRSNPVGLLLEKIGYFRTPTTLQIWILGFIGLLSLFFSLTIQGSEAAEKQNLGAIGQLIMVMKNFAIAPVCLLFGSYWGNYRNVKKGWIITYLILVSTICIASTRREIMLAAAVVAFFMWFINKLTQSKRLFSTKNIIGILILLLFITGPISDLSNAMIASRKMSYTTSSSEAFDNILDLFFDKEKLHSTMKNESFSNTDNNGNNMQAWSEYYVDNTLFDRFCNLRTIDITLDYAKTLGFDNPIMHHYVFAQIIFLLPSPVLNILGIKIDKFANQYTPGDLMSTLVLKYKEQYHGYRIAGDTAVGLFWLGYKYYIVAFFIYTLLFLFFSCLAGIRNGKMLIPVPIMITLNDYIFYFNNSTGIIRTIRYLLRIGWQNIFVYCILMFIINFLFSNQKTYKKTSL